MWIWYLAEDGKWGRMMNVQCFGASCLVALRLFHSSYLICLILMAALLLSHYVCSTVLLSWCSLFCLVDFIDFLAIRLHMRVLMYEASEMSTRSSLTWRISYGNTGSLNCFHLSFLAKGIMRCYSKTDCQFGSYVDCLFGAAEAVRNGWKDEGVWVSFQHRAFCHETHKNSVCVGSDIGKTLKCGEESRLQIGSWFDFSEYLISLLLAVQTDWPVKDLLQSWVAQDSLHWNYHMGIFDGAVVACQMCFWHVTCKQWNQTWWMSLSLHGAN